MKKLVIFDFDGTLAETQDIWLSVLNKLAKKHNYKQLEKTRVNHFKNECAEEIIKELQIPFWKLPFIVKKAHEEVHNRIDRASAVTGMKELLRDLQKKGENVTIITSNDADKVKSFLKKHKFPYIEKIIGGVALFGKDIKIKRLMSSEKTSAKNTYYIGDEIRDMEAAQKAQVHGIAVTWGFNTKKALKGANPSCLATNPKQILNYIEKD